MEGGKPEEKSPSPSKIRLTKIEDKNEKSGTAVVQVEFSSAVECHRVEQSYNGLAIPHTHGYHHFQFHKTWPVEANQEQQEKSQK